MNMPLEQDDDRLIDQLVDGELPDALRRELLLRLDSDPDGWRRCALAFLESQSWREALHPLTAPARPAAPLVEMFDGPDRKPALRRPLARLAALATGLAAAFAIGWVLHGQPWQDAPHASTAPGERSAAVAPSVPAQPAPRETAAMEPQPSVPEKSTALLDPVVKQLEQRGYRAEMQKRLVSMELKDGRKLDIPVQELRVRYIGARTY